MFIEMLIVVWLIKEFPYQWKMKIQFRVHTSSSLDCILRHGHAYSYLRFLLHFQACDVKVKGKAIPVTGREGP
jgi:hypothetical protein